MPPKKKYWEIVVKKYFEERKKSKFTLTSNDTHRDTLFKHECDALNLLLDLTTNPKKMNSVRLVATNTLGGALVTLEALIQAEVITEQDIVHAFETHYDFLISGELSTDVKQKQNESFKKLPKKEQEKRIKTEINNIIKKCKEMDVAKTSDTVIKNTTIKLIRFSIMRLINEKTLDVDLAVSENIDRIFTEFFFRRLDEDSPKSSQKHVDPNEDSLDTQKRIEKYALDNNIEFEDVDEFYKNYADEKVDVDDVDVSVDDDDVANHIPSTGLEYYHGYHVGGRNPQNTASLDFPVYDKKLFKLDDFDDYRMSGCELINNREEYENEKIYFRY